MKRLKNFYENIVANTPVGMKKCRKHEILFTEECPYCMEEDYNGRKR